jgi:hypothetical protein
MGGIARIPGRLGELPRDHHGPAGRRAPLFLRGDADGDGKVGLEDPILLLGHLYRGGTAPTCPDAADADDSGLIDLADPVAILRSLFLGAGPLPEPGPAAAWIDETADDLECGR